MLIFAWASSTAQHIVRVLASKHGIECGFVSGETPTPQRDETLGRFRRRRAQVPVQRQRADHRLRRAAHRLRGIAWPTMSPGLYYQMVGRGFRLHPGKQNCLVLDFGGNVLRHGPVDQIRSRRRKVMARLQRRSVPSAKR